MNEVSQILQAINNLSPRIPVTIDNWSVKEIAAYLKRSEAVVRDRVVHVPDFPKAIRIPTGTTGRGQPLWKAAEVIAWAESYQDK